MTANQDYEDYSKPIPMNTFGASKQKQKNSGLGLSILNDEGSKENILPHKVVLGINN